MPKLKVVPIFGLPSTFERQHPAAPERRGFSVVYRRDEVNHCPGCGRTHWFIGRKMAECAFCETAISLAEAQ